MQPEVRESRDSRYTRRRCGLYGVHVYVGVQVTVHDGVQNTIPGQVLLPMLAEQRAYNITDV